MPKHKDTSAPISLGDLFAETGGDNDDVEDQSFHQEYDAIPLQIGEKVFNVR